MRSVLIKIVIFLLVSCQFSVDSLPHLISSTNTKFLRSSAKSGLPSPEIPVSVGPSAPQQSLLRFKSPSPDLPTSSDSLGSPTIHQSLQNRRSTRSANSNATEFIHQISSLARLANAIVLQTSLLNGVTPIEAVVGELLNLGEHGVKGVVGTEWKKLANLVSKTKFTSLDMTRQDDGSVKLEDVILAWEKIRKSSLLVKKVDLTTVFYKLKTFELKFNTTILDLLLATPMRISEQLQDIRKFALSNSNNQDAVAEYQRLIRFIKKMKNGFQLAAELRPTLIPTSEFADIATIRSAKLFLQLADDRRANDPRFDTSNKDSYVADINQRISSLKPLYEALSPIKAEMKMFLDIVNSRQAPHKIKRSVTSGFSQGVSGINQLKNEIREPWFLRNAANDGSADKLQEALRPIFGGGDKINILEANLSVILTPGVVTSLHFMSAVFDQVSTLSPKLDNPAGIIDQYIACHYEGFSFDASDFEDHKKYITEIDNFYKHYSTFYNSDIVNKDFGWYIKEMDAFLRFIQMTEVADVTPEKVFKMHGRVKTFPEIERFQSSSKKVNDARGGVEAAQVEAFDTILTKKSTIEYSFESSFVQEEMKVYDCMKKLGNKSEQASQAIETTRVIEKLSYEPESLHVTNIETLVAAMKNFSKNLTMLNNISEGMKKQATEASSKLAMPTLISTNIVRSVKYLETVSRLAELKPNISHQQSNIVRAEIISNSDWTKLDEMLKSWDEFGQDLENLQFSIRLLEPLTSRLNDAGVDGIEGYGRVFEGLEQISDVKFDATKGLEVVEALLLNNKSNPEMIKAKKTLDDIANLDLQFSKYPHFSDATFAFQSFGAFIALYPTLLVRDDRVIVARIPEKSNSILIIVCLAVAAIVIIVGVVVLVMWKKRVACFKKKEPEDVPLKIVFVE